MLTVPNIAIVNTVVAVLLLYLQIISSVTAIGLRKGEVRTRYITGIEIYLYDVTN